ncbi:MAG: hypothetical protein H3C62_16025, partial [Gemmatimonadaceae bacterium]|nr:hypothetical protein [Gemmatimonadaceae bacterium]
MFAPRSLLRPLFACAALALMATLASCGREVTGASSAEAVGLPALHLRYPAAFGGSGVALSTLVPFNQVRVHLVRADSTTAFDSTFDFASSRDTLSLSVPVKLGTLASRAGEPMLLTLSYINADRDTVFRGGPATVMAQPIGPDLPAPTPVEVVVRYAGAGASATRVVLDPHLQVVTSGDPFSFEARTVDAGGRAVAGAPVLYRSLDTLRAPLSRYSSGAGLARGSAGDVLIVATMFNGAADTARLVIQRRAARLRIVSGAGQRGAPGSTLPEPVVVRVVDAAEVGVPDVGVSFTPSDDGRLTDVASTTDAEGYAHATWTLASSAGRQTLTVASGTLLGSPFAVSAIATPSADTSHGNGPGTPPSVDLHKTTLSIVSGSGQVARVESALEQPVVVQLLDSAGAPVPDIAIEWTTSGNDGTPSDSLTTTDAKGLSSNKWVLGSREGTLRLKATLAKAGGVSVTFTATALPATSAPPGKLVFATEPSTVAVGATMTPAVVVAAVDAQGKHDSTFTGRVSLALVSPTGVARLTGNATVSAVLGLAVFDRLQFDASESGLTLVASADGLTAATSASFTVNNPPALLQEVSGGSQQAKP